MSDSPRRQAPCQGPHRQRRRDPRHPRGHERRRARRTTHRCGLGRRRAPRHGRRRRQRRQQPARDVWRLRRTDRVDRRHGLRAARPDPRRHPRGRSSARRRAWPRRCGSSVHWAGLSRGIAGVCGQAIICNTPGSPKGCVEQLGAILDIVPHAVRLLRGIADRALTTAG